MVEFKIIYEDGVPCIIASQSDTFPTERNAEDDLLNAFANTSLDNGLEIEELDWGYLIKPKVKESHAE
jgi:hypothetical protein